MIWRSGCSTEAGRRSRSGPPTGRPEAPDGISLPRSLCRGLEPRTSLTRSRGWAGRGQAARQGARGDRPPHLHRSPMDPERRPAKWWPGGGHHPDRRPQHDELLAAQAAGRAQERALESAGWPRRSKSCSFAIRAGRKGTTTSFWCERGMAAGSTPPPERCSNLTAHSGGAQAVHLADHRGPSHGTGSREKVIRWPARPVAAGRRHHGPKCTPRAEALSDGAQDLVPRPVRPADARGPL